MDIQTKTTVQLALQLTRGNRTAGPWPYIRMGEELCKGGSFYFQVEMSLQIYGTTGFIVELPEEHRAEVVRMVEEYAATVTNKWV
jgi:hypothetical protein